MRALPLLAAFLPFAFAASTLAAPPGTASPQDKAPEAAPATSNDASVSKVMMTDNPAAAARMVWVIASAKIYHCPADLWFGRTAEGQYMSEDDARARGFRPDKGKA